LDKIRQELMIEVGYLEPRTHCR